MSEKDNELMVIGNLRENDTRGFIACTTISAANMRTKYGSSLPATVGCGISSRKVM
jgi:hypothetical protein